MSSHTKNLLIALLATIIWFFIMRPFTPINIVTFELAGSTEAATTIINQWGADKVSSVKTSIYLDFVFIISYCAACMYAIRAAAGYANIAFFIKVGKQIIVMVWVAGMCDAIENIAMLKTLGEVSPTSVSIAFYFAAIKFGILLMALIFILISLPIGVLTKLKN